MSRQRQTYMFIPPESDINHPVVQHLARRFPPLEIDKFKTFSDERILRYIRKTGKSFCDKLEFIIEHLADNKNNITLVTMDEVDVYGLLIFNIHPEKENVDIYVELLCGNKALPSTGEGSRLLKILEEAGFETGNYNLNLESALDATDYYRDRNYHPTHGLPPSRHYSDMTKNTRAVMRWKKVKNSTFTPRAIEYLNKEYLKTKTPKAKGKKQKRNKTCKAKKCKRN